jgi:multidrug efflux pump subunit AcrB
LPSKVALPPAAELVDGLADRRLDLVALRRGYDSQEATYRAAILARFPKVELGIAHTKDTGNFYTLGPTLGFDIPALDMNQGNIAIEKATRQKLFDEFTARVFEARSEIATFLAEIDSITQKIAYAEAAVPQPIEIQLFSDDAKVLSELPPGVRVWTPNRDRATDLALPEIPLRAPDGHVFPLKRVAAITPVIGQPQITRDNLRRMVAVTGRIAGRDMGSTIAAVKQALAKPGLLPPGMSYTLGGLYAQQQIAFRGLVAVLVAAVVLVFLLLMFLYEQFRVAVAMLLTTLLAATAVFIGLALTKTELNITSMMGLTMVVGIVTEVAIFYYSEFQELSELPAAPGADGLESRLIRAGLNRMRPIAMTTVAAILALMPLAVGWGQGAAMQQPLAIAIIAGLTVQLPLALIVLPALLAILLPKRPSAWVPA